MVRKYKKKIGARQYRNYSEDILKEAVKEIAAGKLKFRDAVDKYKISTGTLVKYVRIYKQALKSQGSESDSDPNRVLNKLPNPNPMVVTIQKTSATKPVVHVTENSVPISPGTSMTDPVHDSTRKGSMTLHSTTSDHESPRIMENVALDMLTKMRCGPKTNKSNRFNLFVKPISYEEYEKTMMKPSTSNDKSAERVKPIGKTKKKKINICSNSEFEPEVLELKKFAWVIVQYALKKSKKHFVGQVLEIKPDGYYRVEFIAAVPGGFIWPEVKDCDEISQDDIIKILPEPTPSNQGILKFTGISFAGLNIQ